MLQENLSCTEHAFQTLMLLPSAAPLEAHSPKAPLCTTQLSFLPKPPAHMHASSSQPPNLACLQEEGNQSFHGIFQHFSEASLLNSDVGTYVTVNYCIKSSHKTNEDLDTELENENVILPGLQDIKINMVQICTERRNHSFAQLPLIEKYGLMCLIKIESKIIKVSPLITFRQVLVRCAFHFHL